MSNINLLFNFIGVCVADWLPAFQFFNETLGMKAKREPKYGDWALLGVSWDAYYKEGNRSATFELFDRGRVVTERRWGLSQGIRPGFHVSNLHATVEKLRAIGNIQINEITNRPWGETAEIVTIEGIRFAFAEIPEMPFSDNLSEPYIGHVGIKCENFEAMQNFYGNTLGLIRTESGSDYAVFTQKDKHPSIILESGGNASGFDLHNTVWEKNAVRAFPVFISLMTTDIHSIHAYFKSQNVVILRDIVSNADWGGIDFHIADPDGNGIQIVQLIS